MAQHPHAGQPARLSDLTNIPRLVSAYYLNKPDMSRPEQRVALAPPATAAAPCTTPSPNPTSWR